MVECGRVQKLRKWGSRSVPLDDKAGQVVEALFSLGGLRVGKQRLAWNRGSRMPCFPGCDPKTPVTIQAHGQALHKACINFAEFCKDDAMLLLSGHSMRRTAVHLFEEQGIAPSMGMAFTGHKSVSVYLRYANRPSPRSLQKVSRVVFGDMPEASEG